MAAQRQALNPQTVQKIAEAHQEQYIDRVLDVPAEREPGDAEDSRSCYTKCYNDMKETIEHLVEVLQIQCQKVIRHVTAHTNSRGNPAGDSSHGGA